jgi:small subunit ribosomal protein S19
MVKVFSFRGHNLEEIKKMNIDEFGRLLNSRERRTLKRGMLPEEKNLLERIRKEPAKYHKTHLRNMLILPDMLGVKMGVYVGGSKVTEGGGGGSKWASVVITPEMLGHKLGEFALTCKRVKHSAPGVGATRGSKHIPMK